MPVSVATFDLDHTLVRRRSNSKPTLKMAVINRSIERVFNLKNIDYFSILGPELYGMTDRSILRQVLLNLGIDKKEIEQKLDRLFEVMLNDFKAGLSPGNNNEYELLPYIEEFLETLEINNIVCGLATGNYRQFAQWKLSSVGLEKYFSFGGYGEDSEERGEIVRIALTRSGLKNGEMAAHFGDTPADIKAAAMNNMLSVAITVEAGGKFTSDELRPYSPSLLLESYADYNKVLELFNI